ncbi:hypothetical protein CR513_30964, partial [Mucuna pruriens]
MSFVIGLHCIGFGASVADPLLVIAVFPSEMFLYANEVTESVTRVMVQTSRLRADKYSLLHHRAPCGDGDASEGSGPSEILGCRSHTHSDLIPARSWVPGVPAGLLFLLLVVVAFSAQEKGSEVGTDEGDELLTNMSIYPY